MLWLAMAMMIGEAVGPKALGDVSMWITADDYPASEIAKAVQGKTTVELLIDREGHVANCDIAYSSGSVALDATACALIKARARFVPGHDGNGKAVDAVYTRTIDWRIPEGEATTIPTKAQVVAIAVNVDSKGSIVSCAVTEGAGLAKEGQPSACIRYPVGGRSLPMVDANGKPSGYRMTFRSSVEFQPMSR